MSESGDLFVEFGSAAFALFVVRGHKDDTYAISALLWQGAIEFFAGNLIQEFVREGSQDTCAVTGVFLVTDGASMFHTAVHVFCISHDLMTGSTFDVAYETDPTAVLFVCGVIQAVLFRQPTVYAKCHFFALLNLRVYLQHALSAAGST